jgi:peptidyl-prolyl cis-trans isomerase A (cyclophilin A)
LTLAILLGALLAGCGQRTAEEIAGDSPADEVVTKSTDTGEVPDKEATEAEAESHPTEASAAQVPAETNKPAGSRKKEKGLYAEFDTTKGKIVCRLFEDKAPLTVKNFVGLAKGTKEWTDPKTQQKVKRPYFDGLKFHRVIPDFMIQGGDPLGTGTGGPGYQFEDEFDASLRFDKKGKLAMANAGPNTNGSQFFLTVAPTPHLTGKHTIFGEVVEGQDVADAISQAPTGPGDQPTPPIAMKAVKIIRAEGEPAKTK